MKQTTKKKIAILLVTAMLCSILPSTALADETQTPTQATEKNITLGTSALKGGQKSNVYFGNYQQSSLGSTKPTDGTEDVDWIMNEKATNNGQGAYYSKDPIKWRVFSNADGKVFLLSDKNLDVVQYDVIQSVTPFTVITWEISTIRSWLNGYGDTANKQSVDYSNDNFIGSAFSENEQNAIAITDVINATYDGTIGTHPNPQDEKNISGGNDTKDKVFLLSIAEVSNTAYGFSNDRNARNTMDAVNTAYVSGGGKLGSNKMLAAGMCNYWWLRSPGKNQARYAAYVMNDNYGVSYFGESANRTTYAVRPALNIDSSAVLFTSPAIGEKSGTFSVNGEYTGNDYKLTVFDENRSDFIATLKSLNEKVATISYSGATVGTNEYISAIIKNGDTVKYYGRVANISTASGEVDITLPSDFDKANGDVLCVFNEQCNGDYKTDFSSAFRTVLPAASDFIFTPPTDLIYDGKAKIATVTSSQIRIDGITVKYYDADGNKIESPINAGTYSVKIDVTIGANKTEATDITDDSWTFTIKQANPEIEVTTGSAITYGDTLTLTAKVGMAKAKTKATTDTVYFYVGEDEIPLGTTDVKYDDETKKDNGTAMLTINTTDKKLKIGENTIIAEYGGSVNLNGSKKDNITVTLNQKEVGLTWSGYENLVYDGKAKRVTASAIGFVDGDNVSIDVAGGTETNAGTYTATATLTGTDKTYYKLATNNTMKYTITKKSSGSVTATYTVKFDTNGGSAVKNQTVTEYQKAKEPTVPTKDGYTFAGWYSDKALTKAYDFTAKVTQNMTLYAKWITDDEKDSEDKQENDSTEIWKNPFTDVKVGDWYYNAVKYANQNKLMGGMTSNTFAPNAPLTRGMLVTILYRMEGNPTVAGDMPFNDVNANAYYYNAILWAVQNNIISGVADDLFAPDANITREQVIIMLYRYAQYKGYDTTQGGMQIREYNDYDKISDYAKSAMTWAVNTNLLKGRDDNALAPQDNITRAEIAAILQRFVETNQ